MTYKYSTVDLLDRIAKEFNLKDAEASKHIEGIVQVITASIVEGRTVEIRRFGTFKNRVCSGQYRNPATGEVFEEGTARRRVKFSGSKNVKDRYTETAKRLGEI